MAEAAGPFRAEQIPQHPAPVSFVTAPTLAGYNYLGHTGCKVMQQDTLKGNLARGCDRDGISMKNFCCPWQIIGLKLTHHAIGNTELICSGTNDIFVIVTW